MSRKDLAESIAYFQYGGTKCGYCSKPYEEMNPKEIVWYGQEEPCCCNRECFLKTPLGKEDKINYLNDKLADKTLSFGCRLRSIRDWYGKQETVTFTKKVRDGYVGTEYMYEYVEGSAGSRLNPRWWKIIGHPVSLARVLLKINEKFKDMAGNFCIGSHGLFGCFDAENLTKFFGPKGNSYKWNFEKDSLESQTPETIDFLYNLFKDE